MHSIGIWQIKGQVGGAKPQVRSH